jgi:hypothetical protein
MDVRCSAEISPSATQARNSRSSQALGGSVGARSGGRASLTLRPLRRQCGRDRQAAPRNALSPDRIMWRRNFRLMAVHWPFSGIELPIAAGARWKVRQRRRAPRDIDELNRNAPGKTPTQSRQRQCALPNGSEVTHETIRAWEIRFATLLAEKFRRKRSKWPTCASIPRPSCRDM